MEERLKELARQIHDNNDVLSVYEELVNIFDDNYLFHEEGAVIEKIWHITREHELYKKIGDVFFYKVRNKDISISAYNRYLQFSQPEFYKSYADNLEQLGYTNLKFEPDNEDYTKYIIELCDRYNAIVYIIICLHKMKKYDAIMEVKSYLNDLKQEIDLISKTTYEKEDMETIEEINISNKHLSEVLSETEHRNDINEFAIELFPENERACINILGDFITYKNYKQAVSFYNSNYATMFNKSFTTDISTICWQISDFYRDRFEFYNSVLFQKYALEIDLGE